MKKLTCVFFTTFLIIMSFTTVLACCGGGYGRGGRGRNAAYGRCGYQVCIYNPDYDGTSDNVVQCPDNCYYYNNTINQ